MILSVSRLAATVRLSEQSLALAFESLAQCTQIFQRDLVAKEVLGPEGAKAMQPSHADKVDSLGPTFTAQLETQHK